MASDPLAHLRRRRAGGNGLGMPQTIKPAGDGEAASNMVRAAAPKTETGLMRGSSLSVGPRAPAPVSVGEGKKLPGVSGRLTTLLDSKSPYLDRARYRGRQAANRRGLANSSIAAGAAETAAIDAALPIATGDAEIAARERGLRSAEFMQTRDITSREFMQARDHRVQQLMQQRGLDHDSAERQADRDLREMMQTRDHRVQQLMQTERLDQDAAQRQADRELRDLMQTRDHRIQQLMQTERLDHDTAQRLADRELQQELQKRGFEEAARERGWRGGQAERDRAVTRQGIASGERQASARLQASREESTRNAANQIQQNYMQNRLQVQQNPNLNQEDRDRILNDLARQRDTAMRISGNVGNYRSSWPSDDPGTGGAVIRTGAATPRAQAAQQSPKPAPAAATPKPTPKPKPKPRPRSRPRRSGRF